MGLRCSTVNVCMFLLIIFTRITRIIGHSFYFLELDQTLRFKVSDSKKYSVHVHERGIVHLSEAG